MSTFTFLVAYSASKDTLKVGQLVSGRHCVSVLAANADEAALVAEQIVACHGEPTSLVQVV